MAKSYEPDFLDEIIQESTERDARFPALLAAAEARRALVRELVAVRKQKGLSQTGVAAAMNTSQSAIARLEGLDDAKESTLDRYATAIGVKINRTVVTTDPAIAG
jgi:DNA-binding transcriptional regulator YiaG